MNVEDNQPHTSLGDVAPLWKDFSDTFDGLERSIQQFQNTIQELSSSLDLSVSLQNLSDSISMVSWILQENTSQLFPDIANSVRLPHLQSGRVYDDVEPPLPNTVPKTAFPKRRPLHQELSSIADDIADLQVAVMSFPEFGRLIYPSWPMSYIEKDLRYWSSCLSNYSDDYTLRGVRLYVFDLSREIGIYYGHMTRIITALTHRVPAVLACQNHMLSNLQSLSTMATFFSGVTATVLQYSFEDKSSGLPEAVNAFWFGSLVFSVASALTGFLAYMWRKAMYSSPRTRLPTWVWTWLRMSPGFFLVASCIAFLCGLTCFSVSTQARGTQIVVFLCVGVSLFSIAPLLFWSATDKLRKLPHDRYLHMDFEVPAMGLQHYNEPVLPMYTTNTQEPEDKREHAEGNDLGTKNYPPVSRTLSSEPFSMSTNEAPSEKEVQVPTSENLISNLPLPQQRLRRVAVQLILRQRIINMGEEKRTISELERKLRNIQPIGEDLQFDEVMTFGYPAFKPDGSALAFATAIRTLRYELEQLNLAGGRDLPARLNFIGLGVREVCWTYNGDFILTWIHHGNYIDIWPKDGRPITMRRRRGIHCIQPLVSVDTPCPKFLIVEGFNKLIIADVRGEEYMQHTLPNVNIHHLDIIKLSNSLSNTSIVMAVTVLRSTEDFRPVHALPMRKLIVFDIDTFQVQCEVPVWRGIKYVSACRKHGYFAVSYDDESPQIWSVESRENKLYLSLSRQLRGPASTTKFRGRTQWLNNGHFLLSLTTEGDICFWRQDREQIVHLISNPDTGDKLVIVACNTAGEDFMFVTKSERGVIRVWNATDTLQSFRGDHTNHFSIPPPGQ